MGTTTIYGPDLLEGHGTFAIDNDPFFTSIGSEWTVGSDVATATSLGSSTSISKTAATTGKYYRIKFTLVSRVGGTGVRANVTGVNGTIRNTAGTYEEILGPATGTGFTLQSVGTGGTYVADDWEINEISYKRTSRINLAPSGKLSL